MSTPLACGGEGDDASPENANGAAPTSGGSSGTAGTAPSGGAGAAVSGASSGGASGSSAGGSSGAMAGSSGMAGGAGRGTGGSPTGGTLGTGGSPSVGPGPCGCATPAGEFGTVSETIVVDSGETYDGGCRIFRADPNELGDGSQEEGQLPVFEVDSGGTLRNVVIGASGADGIHVSGNVTLENVHWLDIGEDALTVDGSGTVTVNCGSAANSADKVFQVNSTSTLRISNFTVRQAGKFIRQNGSTMFRVDVFIDHSDISNMSESIFRTDSTSSHITLTNSRYSNIGDGLFIFGSRAVDGNSDQSTVSNNQEY
jgi:pectate lyase C